MAKFAILDNDGVVTNVIVADPSAITTFFPESICVKIEDKHFASIGEKFETYKDRLAREVAAEPVEELEPPVE
jgi:hypothetical protein